jgi:hypothetical protein
MIPGPEHSALRLYVVLGIQPHHQPAFHGAFTSESAANEFISTNFGDETDAWMYYYIERVQVDPKAPYEP